MTKKTEIFRLSNPYEFYRRLSHKYKIDFDRLKALTRDFESDLANQYRLGIDSYVLSSISDIASEVGLPPDTVWDLRQTGGTHKPINSSDLTFLKHFRLSLKNTSSAPCKRSQDSLHPELSAPWKRYVYQSYLNNIILYDGNGRMLNPEKRIYVRRLAKKIAVKFDLKDDPELWDTIRKIREIAQNRKRD